MGKNALGCKSTVQAVGTQLAHSERPRITGQRAAPAIGLKVSQGNVGVNWKSCNTWGLGSFVVGPSSLGMTLGKEYLPLSHEKPLRLSQTQRSLQRRQRLWWAGPGDSWTPLCRRSHFCDICQTTVMETPRTGGGVDPISAFCRLQPASKKTLLGTSTNHLGVLGKVRLPASLAVSHWDLENWSHETCFVVTEL